jgi:hypothetical protein
LLLIGASKGKASASFFSWMPCTALVQSAEIAAAAVVVDAIDAGAVTFYQPFAFVPFSAIASRLFLAMKAVASLFR